VVSSVVEDVNLNEFDVDEKLTTQ